MRTTTFPPTSTAHPTLVDEVQASNFRHLYWDIVWYGIAFGSTLSFLPVFAARLGAVEWQLGLLAGGPALLNTFCTLPASRWLESRSLSSSVVLTAILHRLGFLLLVPLPLLLPASWQIWAVLLLVLLMALPGAALAIGFNALLAAVVPSGLRGHVVGRRNALLGATIALSFLLCGQILTRLPFAWGYTVVFALGTLGAIVSTYHLWRIQVPALPPLRGVPMNDRALPGQGAVTGDTPQRAGIAVRLWLRSRSPAHALQGRVSRTFLVAMVAFFFFHFAQFLPASLFPLFWVNEALLDDGTIGWLNVIFYLSMLIASPFLGRLTERWGSRLLSVWGAILLAAYPLLTALSEGLPLLILASLSGGLTWAILGGALANRLLEIVPEDDRPVHLAFYNMALNVATLAGTMLGAGLASQLGVREALLIAFTLRLLAGFVLARWG